VKATSIVDGVQQQAIGDVQTVHLNLLSKAGRQVGASYGIKIIPATLVLDQDGRLLYRRHGFPEGERIQRIVSG
jgi:hypothetical protein